MNWLKQQVANVAGTAEPIYGPSALRSVAKQAETIPYTESTKEDLRWAAMDSTCVETQTFYLMADSGHVGMAQVIYSNVAGIRTTVQFNTKISYPDGKTPHLWSSDALEGHGFDESKSCLFADGCALDLSDDGTCYAIKSATNETSLVNLKVTRTSPGFKVGKDGTSLYGTDPEKPWGSMKHIFWPRCTVEGNIVTKYGEVNFKGRALFIHALQGMKPHHAAARWNFLNFQSPLFSAVMMEFTTPPSYGSSTVNVGGVAVDGEILFAGANNRFVHTEKRNDPDWPEPGALKLEWNGKTKDHKIAKAELSGNLGERLDKIDVMAQVPGFIKTIVGGVVGTRPFIYQYSPKPRLLLKVTIDGEEKVEEGETFCESTFICE